MSLARSDAGPRTAVQDFIQRRSRRPVVLVVDDEAGFARRLGMAFEECGFEPETAFDGEQALNAVAKRCPDLIVMDVKMPRMDGIECLAALRASDPNALPPVILVSGDPSPCVDLAGSVYAGTYVIRKPCTYDEIVAFGHQILARAG